MKTDMRREIKTSSSDTFVHGAAVTMKVGSSSPLLMICCEFVDPSRRGSLLPRTASTSVSGVTILLRSRSSSGGDPRSITFVVFAMKFTISSSPVVLAARLTRSWCCIRCLISLGWRRSSLFSRLNDTLLRSSSARKRRKTAIALFSSLETILWRRSSRALRDLSTSSYFRFTACE